METVWAVHVADGQLSSRVCLAGWVAAGILLAFALRKTKPDEIPKVAVLSAVFFLASLLHVPTIIGARTHLLLTGLLGLLLGWQSLIAIGCGLCLQAILFSHGGVFSLGINLLVMGIPALVCGRLFQLWALTKSTNLSPSRTTAIWVPGFVLGALSVLLVASLYGLALLCGGVADWWPQILATWIIHVPLAILEGFICAGVVEFQGKVAPESLLVGGRHPANSDSGTNPVLGVNCPGEADPPA